MTRREINPASGPLKGTIRVPGDKSLSHRAVLFSSMAQGTSRLEGVLASEDVLSTIAACRALGGRIDAPLDADGRLGTVVVQGWGDAGPVTPSQAIDCGNSGTTVRLLMGVLAGWPVQATLTGDESLSKRPMRRVTVPLESMGARFEASEEGTLPVVANGAYPLVPITYDSPVASAQVKTAILLAGLRAQGTTRVSEPSLSRDHTERLLPAFGVPVAIDDAPGASVTGPASLRAHDLSVPADPSSAAFLAVAACIVPGSRVVLPEVSLNPTRIGFVEVLRRMRADVSVSDVRSAGSEPLGTITVCGTHGMVGTLVTAQEVPTLVDEIPVLAVAAACATGTTRFEGVGELRVKESDRLEAIAEGLTAFGVTVRSGEDWLEVDGGATLRPVQLDSQHDHRLAMTWAVAALVASGPCLVTGWDAVAVSYPRFEEDLRRLGAY